MAFRRLQAALTILINHLNQTTDGHQNAQLQSCVRRFRLSYPTVQAMQISEFQKREYPQLSLVVRSLHWSLGPQVAEALLLEAVSRLESCVFAKRQAELETLAQMYLSIPVPFAVPVRQVQSLKSYEERVILPSCSRSASWPATVCLTLQVFGLAPSCCRRLSHPLLAQVQHN